MRTSALWSGLTTSLTNPTAVAAVASVGMHAILGVTLPALPFFAPGSFPEGETVVSSRGVDLAPMTLAQYQSLPAAVRNPALLRPQPQTLLGAFPSTTQTGLPGFSTLPQAPTTTPPRSSTPSRPSTPTQRRTTQTRTPQTKPTQKRQTTLPAPQPRSSPVIVRPGNQSRTNPRRSTTTRLAQPPTRPAKEKSVREPIAALTPGDIEVNEQAGFRIYDRELFQNDLTIAVAPESAPTTAASSSRPTIEQERRSLQASLQPRSLAEQATVDENHAQFHSRHPEPQSITIAGRYPSDACYLKGAERVHVVYGATLQADGRAQNLNVIGGSGIRAFVRQAQHDIQKYRFNTVEQPTPAEISVSFNRINNSTCPEATRNPPTAATSQTDTTPQTTTRSRPQPQPSPSPTPEASPAEATLPVLVPPVETPEAAAETEATLETDTPNSEAASSEAASSETNSSEATNPEANSPAAASSEATNPEASSSAATTSPPTEPSLIPPEAEVILVLPESETATTDAETPEADAIESETDAAAPEATDE